MGTSSNRKVNIIGGNGQISPVSHNSLIYTENDHKFSFGSYAPSHISSYGGAANHANLKSNLQMEIGQVRLSLLNFASTQIQN